MQNSVCYLQEALKKVSMESEKYDKIVMRYYVNGIPQGSIVFPVVGPPAEASSPGSIVNYGGYLTLLLDKREIIIEDGVGEWYDNYGTLHTIIYS